MNIELCKCEHEGHGEWHLRYPGLTESAARYIRDQINAGALMVPLTARRAGSHVERNNPLSALAIRLLVGAGRVSQDEANEAFHIACTALQAEAERMNVSLPWVVVPFQAAADPGQADSSVAADACRAEQVTGPILGWSECKAIGEIRVVDEAMRALLADQTADSATRLIQAVIEAAHERFPAGAVGCPDSARATGAPSTLCNPADDRRG